MASSLRGTQTICGAFSKTAPPRYVCRSCRQNLLRPNGQQMRAASTILSSGRTHRGLRSTETQVYPRASYATSKVSDYISPGIEQPTEEFEDYPDEVIYEEATSWRGLEIVGKPHRLGDPQPSADAFQPFLKDRKSLVISRDFFQKHLHRAILDVLINRTLGKDIADLYQNGTEQRARHIAVSLGLAVTESGTLSGLQADSNTLNGAINTPEWKSDITSADVDERLSNLKLNFSDPTTFEILKYFSFLSRHRVPDPIVSNVWNGQKPMTALVDLLTQHYVHSKPKTVSSTLQSRQEKALLAAQAGETTDAESKSGAVSRRAVEPLGPNVMVLHRRETPVDKQKEVGRWKVIEKELKLRGLPVLGKSAGSRKPQRKTSA